MAFRRTSIGAFALANNAYSDASVAFYTVDSAGVRTTTLATLYEGTTGSTTLANPQTLDSEGKFSVPVYVEVQVIGVVSGSNAEDHETGVITPSLSDADVTAAAASAGAAAASASAAAALVADGSTIPVTATGSSTARTLAARAADVMRPEDEGAAGDGATDDTTAFQAALDGADGRVIDLRGDATYRITDVLEIPSNTTIEGNGATIDITDIGSSPYYALRAQGSLGTDSALSANGDEGDFSVDVADGTKFTAGSYVLLTSDGNYANSSSNVDKGEVKVVRSVASNTVTFTTPLLDNYTTADTATLRNVTWLENVRIRNVKIVGSDTAARGERGIVLQYVKNFEVSGCSVDGVDHYCIEATNSIYGRISNNYVRSAFYDGSTGSIFFGIAIVNGSQWIDIEGNRGTRCRHLVVTTAFTDGQGYYGQPLYINVRGNIFFDSMAGGSGRSYAYENHGFGRFITWSGNMADGGYAGMRLESAQDNIVSNNIFRNVAVAGIIIGNGVGLLFRNVKIIDNIINYDTTDASGNYGIFVDIPANSTVDNLEIRGNTMDNMLSTVAGYAIGIFSGASVTWSAVTISDNLMRAFSSDTNTYALRINSTNAPSGFVITGNRTLGFRSGMLIEGDDHIVRGNIIERASAAVSGSGIAVTGDSITVQGNTIRGINLGVWVVSGSANLIVNNQFLQCTTSISDSGTGTISRDNDTGSVLNGTFAALTVNGNTTLGDGSGDSVTINAGTVSAPNIPAVLAHVGTGPTNVTGDGTAYTMIFDTEVYDQGADYNNATGVFTAPTTGIYHVCGTVRISGMTSNNTRGTVSIIASNRSVAVGEQDPYNSRSGDNRFGFPFALDIDMDAADTVSIQLIVSATDKGIDIDSTDANFLSIRQVA